MKTLLLVLPCFLLACYSSPSQGQSENTSTPTQNVDPDPGPPPRFTESGKTLLERIHPPEGYERVPVSPHSFAHYVRNFPLMPAGSLVYTCDSAVIPNDDYYCAVLQVDVGKRDLQQCADAVMRLKAEYHYQNQEFDSIHFDLTNGFLMDYNSWRSGKRLGVNGNRTYWKNTGTASDDYPSFRNYLNWVYMYAGTLSLSKELNPADITKVQPGQVLIQGGSPGHAVTVMDVAVNEQGERLFLLAQSYMPAQNIHVVINRNEPEISPWYRAVPNASIATPAWHFYSEDLKEF